MTATVSAATGTPSGNIQFLDGTTNLGTVAYFGGSSQLGAALPRRERIIWSAVPGKLDVPGKQRNLFRDGTASAGAGNQIQHVVIIFQENRTPDNLFHGFPSTTSPTPGSTRKAKRFRS